ncbi:hypothetical protein SUGI_0100270 [Cryptomeria japonica]|uniref:uncharacterized protein LOC131053552 n=1 Tax=Cryptomeria japonica TaxID=3369 RepID=UPI0024089DCB|nr:uncharacterized protein LOC131053552 [Cryptomeria japonica]GLJ09025.1 hypothetical protein SUGI_0100270 [Cryptomeria japonica]
MEICSKRILFASILLFLCISICYAEDGPAQEDPPEIVGKAMSCFDHVYECPPAHRLTPSGTLNVPYEQTDEYCNSGCYDGTQLVLTCIDQILTNFEFYNKATVEDIRKTIVQACSNTDKRGDFNVMERVTASGSTGKTEAKNIGGVIMMFLFLAGLLLPV